LHYAAINSGEGNGGVYRVTGNEEGLAAIDLNVGGGYGQPGLDISSIAVCGGGESTLILCGAGASGQVYTSDDGGRNWEASRMPPAGEGGTQVLMSADCPTTGRAFAATGGLDSAISMTKDSGFTRYPAGLMDTRIESIIDLAISPDYDRDATLYLLTWGGGFNLWRGIGATPRWQRVFPGIARR